MPPEMNEESSHFDTHTVNVGRTSATVKGGRRFSFGALVIVGDRRGHVGYGYAKGVEVPRAVEKAEKAARRTLITVPMEGNTIPHEVEGTFGASKVRLIPASPGTGVVAGRTLRALLEHAGITDCLTKCYGSTHAMNVLKAALDGIGRLRSPERVAELRGVTLEPTETAVKVAKGRAFMPAGFAAPKPKPRPERSDRQGGRQGGGRGRGGDRGGRGGDRPDRGADKGAEKSADKAPEGGTPAQG